MAFVADNQKLLNQNQGQSGQVDPSQAGGSGGAVTGGQSANTSSSGSGDVSGGGGGGSSPGAQSGTGGVGGWTNIQNYMNANQGDTGSTNRLNGAVGNQFGQERSNLDSQSSQTKQAAQGQANQEKTADSSASQWLGDAAKNYSYGGTQNDAYNQNVGNVKNALSAQYSGPTSFSYGFSNDTQQLGQNLGNDQGFNQYMGNLAEKQAGSPMSDGERSLQTQLDVSNKGLQDARQNALQQYAGLGSYRDQTVQDTNAAATKAQQDFANSKTHLNDYLTGQASSDLTKKGNAEQDARSAYQNEFTNGLSGRQGVGAITGLPLVNTGPTNISDIYNNPNLTWANLQRQSDYMTNAPAQGTGLVGGLYAQPTDQTQFNQIKSDDSNALNNFYSSEDQKYANTGDQQKREWNAIQDMLNTGAAKQSQGFKVRG